MTLVSNASTTANVAKIDASNFIDGEVTVERHILTGLGSGEHAKTWQALATPTGANSISQSVLDSWMESKISPPPVGYGTHIPDPRSNWSSLGFDGPTVNAITSIKTFDDNAQSFAPIANTGIPLYNKNGYFLFVRGDRYQISVGAQPNPTNMRSKGALFQPHTGYAPPSVTAPAWTGTPPGKYVMVGNPYASAINLNYMYNTSGYFTNLTGIFVVWDVSIPGTQGYGGYQYLDAAQNFIPVAPGPGGTTNYYQTGVSYPEIQSGQAFFVQATNNGSTGSISFNEDAKSSNSRIVTKGIKNTVKRKILWVGLYSGTGICDGTSISFDKDYSTDIGADDAGKLPNPGENFMILKGNGATLAIEKRQPINQLDTIIYTFNNLRKITYHLKFAPELLQEEGLHATLIDNYLHSRTSLSLADSSFIDFIVDNNKASFEKRFTVVFERNVDPGISKYNDPGITSIFVYPNPVENKTIKLCFVNQVNGRYTILLINQTGQVVYKNSLKISNSNTTTAINFSGPVAAGSYELSIIAPDGKKSVRKIVVK